MGKKECKKEREEKARRVLVAFASSVRLSGFDAERDLPGALFTNSSFGGGNVASSVSSGGVEAERQCSDVKKKEYAVLKMKEWEEVVEQIVAKMPSGTSMNVYKCLFPKTNRLLICRSMDCSEFGSFYGFSTNWISSCDAGGWKFACPHCAHPHSMNLQQNLELIPANYIWQLESNQSVMLAEWPNNVNEKAFNMSAEMMAEHAVKHKFDRLSQAEVTVKIGYAVSKTAVAIGELRTMKLSKKVMTHIAHLNSNCGSTTLPYSCDHLIANGYRGRFFKFVPGVTPVMKAADCMDYLSLHYCLMLKKACEDGNALRVCAHS